jgi:hypothetical protein
MTPILMFVGFIVLACVLGYLGHLQAKKRREGFQLIAQELGFRYSPDKDHSFANCYSFLEHMDDGHNRYAFNILSGEVNNQRAHIFDYHYETYSRDNKGRRTTHNHVVSIFVLAMPEGFPELNIEPEGFFSKIGQALGFDDIDFESVEFSKRYKVKSQDKKFAYDFCNAQMIDYLQQQQQNLIIEVDGNTLALTFKGKLDVAQIRPNFDRLLTIRSLIPNYLFTA